MDLELQQKLYNAYPKIFVQKDLDMTLSCMCFGICCGDGWYNIINNACLLIQQRLISRQHVKQVEAVQVKEKYGSLRFYYDGGDDYINGVVAMAEELSIFTCERCGGPVKASKFNPICTNVNCSAPVKLIDRKNKKGAVAIDFDGVINSYKSGFVAIDNIPDSPVDGAFEFIEKLLNYGYTVYIYSTRNYRFEGQQAISKWMLDHGMPNDILSKLIFPKAKPIAKIYIDDRAWLFNGTWPDIKDIDNFKPWHGGKSSSSI
ncbi:MAG: hypothetical protein Q8P20_00295 [bacterium]|nr:hypothetical protein [bacterium]